MSIDVYFISMKFETFETVGEEEELVKTKITVVFNNAVYQ